jgi:hypothetical protein
VPFIVLTYGREFAADGLQQALSQNETSTTLANGPALLYQVRVPSLRQYGIKNLLGGILHEKRLVEERDYEPRLGEDRWHRGDEGKWARYEREEGDLGEVGKDRHEDDNDR